jgi:hypothetical protein
MLPYFFAPELDIGLEKFNSIIIDTVESVIDSNVSTNFKINVSEHKILTELKEKYPILGDIINIYVTRIGGSIPPHQDASRSCAINFPIQDTNKSSTIFYEPVGGETQYKFNRTFIWNFPVNEVREIFRFTLTEPVVINNNLIHGVTHHGDKCRIIASWSIKPEYSFEDAVEFFTRYPGGVSENNPSTTAIQM